MMPLSTQRCAMRKATRVGSRAIRYDAKATLKLVVNWSWNRYWTTGRVWYFGLAVISCGIMKSFQDQFTTNFNVAFASYLMALLPTLVVFLLAQRWVVSGIMRGSIK